MRALTVRPGVADSLALVEVPEPEPREGAILVDAVAVGLCGTDWEIVRGGYGEAPSGSDRLIIGHENLGRVAQAPPDSGFAAGDLVVAVVRRPDPAPCPACRVGEWDMCFNGRYTEHGIRGLSGFARPRWRADPDALIRLDPALAETGVLMEPTSIVAKAWEQVDRIGRRAYWEPAVAAVTGAGPVGLLAALLGTQRGLQVHVYDVTTTGPKPDLVAGLGATFHGQSLPDSGVKPDIVLECTGAASAVLDALGSAAGMVCLMGVAPVGAPVPVDVGRLSRDAVLGNHVVFGTVSANRRHFDAAGRALAAADPGWLRELITRRAPLARYGEALRRTPTDVKVVLDL